MIRLNVANVDRALRVGLIARWTPSAMPRIAAASR